MTSAGSSNTSWHQSTIHYYVYHQQTCNDDDVDDDDDDDDGDMPRTVYGAAGMFATSTLSQRDTGLQYQNPQHPRHLS